MLSTFMIDLAYLFIYLKCDPPNIDFKYLQLRCMHSNHRYHIYYDFFPFPNLLKLLKTSVQSQLYNFLENPFQKSSIVLRSAGLIKKTRRTLSFPGRKKGISPLATVSWKESVQYILQVEIRVGKNWFILLQLEDIKLYELNNA